MKTKPRLRSDLRARYAWLSTIFIGELDLYGGYIGMPFLVRRFWIEAFEEAAADADPKNFGHGHGVFYRGRKQPLREVAAQ